MVPRSLIWLLCAGVGALACRPHARGDARKAPAKTSSAAMAPVHAATMGADSVANPLATTFNVSVSRGVTFGLHVTNRSGKLMELPFSSGQTHDFTVLDSAGRQVWRWSAGRLFTQGMRNTVLDAHGTVTYEERWDAAGRAGRFTAVALLNSAHRPVIERVQFMLP